MDVNSHKKNKLHNSKHFCDIHFEVLWVCQPMSDHIFLIFMSQLAVSFINLLNQPAVFNLLLLWAYLTISNYTHLILLSQYVTTMDFHSHTKIPPHKLSHSWDIRLSRILQSHWSKLIKEFSFQTFLKKVKWYHFWKKYKILYFENFFAQSWAKVNFLKNLALSVFRY